MAKPKRAYPLGDRRYTPSQFRRLSAARKVEAMVGWFFSRFEDPAQRISYDGREGGYQWAGYGPHMAREVLPDEFGDLASGRELEAATREIERNGLDWASTTDLDNEDDISSVDEPLPDWDEGEQSEDDAEGVGRTDSAGVGFAIFAQRSDGPDPLPNVLSSLDRFEAELEVYSAHRGHRGHNHPPELLDDEDPITDEDLTAARRALVDIRAEAAASQPNAAVVKRSATVIADLGRKVWTALKTLLADARSGIVGSVAFAGVQAVWAYREELGRTAMDAANAVARWVVYLQGFW